MNIRQAQPGDIDDLLRIQAGAFKFSDDAERCRQVKLSLEQSLDGWMVLPVDGQPVGTVHVARQGLQIGRAVLLKGDVGEVAVSPELHGHGYGTRLMRETVAWMQANGFALSRLGGLVQFYARFGYARFQRRYIEFSVGQTVAAGASQVVESAPPLAEEQARCIRPYHPDTDGTACREMIHEFVNAYTAHPALTDDIPPAGPLSMVYAEGSTIAGYFYARESPQEHTEFEARITVAELEYDRSKPYVIQSLISYLAHYALERGITRITARIPFDPRIVAALSAIPVRFQLMETFGGRSSNMLRVVSLRALLEGLLPELQARLADSGLAHDGAFEILTGEEQAALRISGGQILLTDRAPTRLPIPQYDLISLVLGLLSWDEAEPGLGQSLSPADRALLRALFPRRLVFTGFWG